MCVCVCLFLGYLQSESGKKIAPCLGGDLPFFNLAIFVA